MLQNSAVYSILKKAGWYKDRRLEERMIIQKIQEEGYPLFRAAIEFIMSFGNLMIVFENLQNRIKDDTINLDFEHATHIESFEKIREDYFPRVQKELCLIGTAYRDHLVLLMAEDGNVYGAFEDFLCYIEESGIKAIEAIILNKDFVEIK